MAMPFPESPEAAAAFRKRILRTLRFLLLLAVIGAALPAVRAGTLPWQFWLAAGLFGASNVAFHFDRTDLFEKTRLPFLLFLFDCVILSYMMAASGERTNEFFVLFALTVLMAAMSRSPGGAFASTVAVGALYTMLTLYGRTGVELGSEAFGTRIALLFVVSIFVAFLAHESRQALLAPRLGLDLYRNLFDLNPVYVFLCDRRLRILQVNPLVQAGLGHLPDRLRGRPLAAIADLPEAWRGAALRDAARLEADRQPITLRRADGSTVSVQARIATIVSSIGPLVLLLAQGDPESPITVAPTLDRIELLAGVANLVPPRMAQELARSLATITCAAQFLSDRLSEPALLRQVHLGWAAALRISHVVRNLLIFSPRHAADVSAFDLNRVVSDVLRLKAAEIRAREIKVRWEPDPELPDVSGDAHLIAGVVLNLLENALRSIREGQAFAFIRVRTGREVGGCHLEIADNGHGFPPDVLAHLFEPFVVCPADGRELGLNVSRSIVREHGGDITVRSAPGQGTIFRVELPVPARAGREHRVGAA